MNFLQESNGDNSMLRLMSFLCVLGSLLFASLGFVFPEAKEYALTLVQSFLSAAFLGKVGQKFVEEKRL